MSGDEWIVHDTLMGCVETFKSEDEALAYAGGCIDECGDDGWAEEVEGVVIAKVTHFAAKGVLHRREDFTPDEWEERGWSEFDEIWTYEMKAMPS